MLNRGGLGLEAGPGLDTVVSALSRAATPHRSAGAATLTQRAAAAREQRLSSAQRRTSGADSSTGGIGIIGNMPAGGSNTMVMSANTSMWMSGQGPRIIVLHSGSREAPGGSTHSATTTSTSSTTSLLRGAAAEGNIASAVQSYMAGPGRQAGGAGHGGGDADEADGVFGTRLGGLFGRGGGGPAAAYQERFTQVGVQLCAYVRACMYWMACMLRGT